MSCGGCRVLDHERAGGLMCLTCEYARETGFVSCSINREPIAVKLGCTGELVSPANRVCPIGLDPDDEGVVRWLGLRWIGVPMPRRWLLKRPLRWWWGTAPVTQGIEGCGCILALKIMWESFKRRMQRPGLLPPAPPLKAKA